METAVNVPFAGLGGSSTSWPKSCKRGFAPLVPLVKAG